MGRLIRGFVYVTWFGFVGLIVIKILTQEYPHRKGVGKPIHWVADALGVCDEHPS